MDYFKSKRLILDTEIYNITAKCLFGLEEILKNEIESIGGEIAEVRSRAVSYRGDKSILYKSNLYLRTALRVLVPLKSFKATNEKDIYSNAYDIEWENYLNLSSTFAVDSVLHSKHFNHANYLALKTKDAVADRLRKIYGARPDVNPANPDLRINLYVSGDDAVLSLDSSGKSLHKRGWRISQNDAPLNETLAAGMVILSGWDGESVLYDPMTGSGTIAMEAAAIASGYPPGLNTQFAFTKFPDFDKQLWEKIHDEASANIQKKGIIIYSSDIDKKSLAITRKNFLHSGFNHMIRLYHKDFFELHPDTNSGVVIMNPPYGERMEGGVLTQFYKDIGDTLKQNWQGFEVWIITAGAEALKNVGLHANKKYSLMNGTFECKYVKYNMYSGSIKSKYTNNTESESKIETEQRTKPNRKYE